MNYPKSARGYRTIVQLAFLVCGVSFSMLSHALTKCVDRQTGHITYKMGFCAGDTQVDSINAYGGVIAGPNADQLSRAAEKIQWINQERYRRSQSNQQAAVASSSGKLSTKDRNQLEKLERKKKSLMFWMDDRTKSGSEKAAMRRQLREIDQSIASIRVPPQSSGASASATSPAGSRPNLSYSDRMRLEALERKRKSIQSDLSGPGKHISITSANAKLRSIEREIQAINGLQPNFTEPQRLAPTVSEPVPPVQPPVQTRVPQTVKLKDNAAGTAKSGAAGGVFYNHVKPTVPGSNVSRGWTSDGKRVTCRQLNQYGLHRCQ